MNNKMTHKVLLDASNLIKGGAIQACCNFIIYINKIKADEIEWTIIVNKVMDKQLKKMGVNILCNYIILERSPSKDRLTRKYLLEIEKEISPNLVFTYFGPTYTKFNSYHLSGFANGWVTHSKLKTFFQTYKHDYFTIVKFILKYSYYAFQIRKADEWIFETETARLGFIKRLKVSYENTHVISNSAMDFGDNLEKNHTAVINGEKLIFNDKIFLMLAADYPHKNILSVIEAVHLIRVNEMSSSFKLALTIPHNIYKSKYEPLINSLGIEEYIINIGEVDLVDLPSLYSVTYCSILVSFIETYSAVYPESFLTQTPIITSNEGFAREICKDSALYVEPENVNQISNAIISMVNDKELRNNFIKAGNKMSKSIMLSEQKQQRYFTIISDILNKIE